MTRKITFLTLCAMLFALSLPASAQQPTNVPRLGYLSSLNPATDSTRPEAIRLSMSERGYLEGNFGSSIIFDFECWGSAAQASCRQQVILLMQKDAV